MDLLKPQVEYAPEGDIVVRPVFVEGDRVSLVVRQPSFPIDHCCVRRIDGIDPSLVVRLFAADDDSNPHRSEFLRPFPGGVKTATL